MKLSQKVSLVLAASLGLAAAALAASPSVSADQAINAEQAKTIALNDAGLSAGQIHSIKVHSDSDNDKPVFEVEFSSNDSDYDYTIDAATGFITEKDTDSHSNVNGSQKGLAKISANEAKNKALKDAGLNESRVSSLKVEADSDNDVPTYKIEFKYGKREYRYVLNALNGTITAKETN
ncbi:PepSY domain-containing protein [Streptococcus macacae]|uniref:Peptidase propeptide and YpeB domain protein n=1 Tax=Streptococcus macacae NCTC 11558 TaxID=764298 RepID=G5JYH1_9STRE|nr:PepSY domain-containing protein [Streptococcus macacae]EHJ52229.1 peptidase propeptide and YpeB domain protein [Streptococcus macacae NCTC 11558]SUN78084.1 lipoprotein [Streptococcus macacae NCTC 11558]